SKAGWAQTGEPFCHGESPGANFHGPGKVAAVLPSVIVSAGAPEEEETDCGCACKIGGTRRQANKKDVPILRMLGRVPLVDCQATRRFTAAISPKTMPG